MQPGHAPPVYYRGLPVPGATTLAGIVPRASLAASPTPDEAEARRLTAIINAYESALHKAAVEHWPAADVARIKRQKAQAVAQRQAVFNRIGTSETPSGFMQALSTFSDWATGVIGKAGEGVANLPEAAGKSLPFLALGVGAVALLLLAPRRTE